VESIQIIDKSIGVKKESSIKNEELKLGLDRIGPHFIKSFLAEPILAKIGVAESQLCVRRRLVGQQFFPQRLGRGPPLIIVQ
jgi:hypothetical protein